jgi:hypothetical protein
MCDNEYMRPFGTSEQLARRRQRALELLHHGQPPTKVAKRVGERQGVPAVYPPLNSGV